MRWFRLFIISFALILVAPRVGAQATISVTPTVTLSSDTISRSGTTTKATVHVVDSSTNAAVGGISVIVHVVNSGGTAVFTSAGVGSTDASGNFTTTLGPITSEGTYTIRTILTASNLNPNPTTTNGLATLTVTSANAVGTGSGGTSGTTTQTSTVSIPNPIQCNDATCLVSQVIRYILGIIAIIATLMFVWGGVMMLTSGGNADQVRKARETLVWATIGIIVILLSWVIIKFVLQGLIGTGKK